MCVCLYVCACMHACVYGILHRKVCEMVASIRDTFVRRLSCGYIHEALKQLASITKHLGEYHATFACRLSCGYSRGTKSISKLYLLMEALKSLANKTVKRSHYMK